ncbi:hypothetical protein [Streptomyces chattanoogensis]|uniref:hypothetical protein n=1 Tax=Streptomyces chattanoogensis TaxID=66876 RepID=UPI0036961B7C
MSGAPVGGLLTMPHTAPTAGDWSTPRDSDLLTRVLAAVTRWQPLPETGELLDDLADALDDVPPTDVPNLARRIDGYLAQLVSIALAHGACDRDRQVAGLVMRGRALQDSAPAAPGAEADLRLLRRTSLLVSDLVDRLVAMRHLKEPDGPIAVCFDHGQSSSCP